MTEQTDIARLQADVSWLKNNHGWTFKVALVLVGLAIYAIYGAGANVQKLNSHVERDAEKHMSLDKEIEVLKRQLIEVTELTIMERLGDASATEALEELREDWEKKRPPIYAANDGEETG